MTIRPAILSMPRCFWANPKNPLYVRYHDEEWGVPCHEVCWEHHHLLLSPGYRHHQRTPSRLGYTVVELNSGWLGWTAAGKEIEK